MRLFNGYRFKGGDHMVITIGPDVPVYGNSLYTSAVYHPRPQEVW